MAFKNFSLLCLAIPLFALNVPAQETADTPRHVRTPNYSEEGAESCLRCHAGGEMRAIQDGPHFNLQNPGAPAAHQQVSRVRRALGGAEERFGGAYRHSLGRHQVRRRPRESPWSASRGTERPQNR